jgi:cell division transport system ATP-binding protein
VNRPLVLLADEPTGNLDPKTSSEIMLLLERINRTAGTTVLMATHSAHIVDSMRRRVVGLENGKVIRDERGSYGVNR